MGTRAGRGRCGTAALWREGKLARRRDGIGVRRCFWHVVREVPGTVGDVGGVREATAFVTMRGGASSRCGVPVSIVEGGSGILFNSDADVR